MLANPAQAAFAVPGALVRHALSGRRTGGVPVPEYGMTMWFRVTVRLDGGDLGLWSSCSGLGVEFHADALTVGGHYDRTTTLPGHLTYGNVTLERAMTRTDAAKVESWLAHVSRQWINSAEGGAPETGAGGSPRFHPGTTMTIELYHELGEKPVASWTLRDVVPVSWSAPTLSTASGTVAVEKLVLAHGGFLDSDPTDAPVAKAGQGLLSLSGPGAEPVTFPFNPENVTLERSVFLNAGPGADGDGEHLQISTPNPWSVTYGELVVEGESQVRATTTSLRTWLEPDEVRTGKIPKILLVRFGDGRNTLLTHRVVLTRVLCTYTRFTRAGAPSRAKVTLDFQTLAARPGANTTPDGGEAAGTSGAPPQWRAGARAKGVDDPLRPGGRTPLGRHR